MRASMKPPPLLTPRTATVETDNTSATKKRPFLTRKGDSSFTRKIRETLVWSGFVDRVF